jgi:hypothetical protein
MEEQQNSTLPIDKNRFIRMIDDLKKNRTETTQADPGVFQQLLNASRNNEQEKNATAAS